MNGQSSIFSYKSLTIDENGWFNECSRIPSPHFNERPQQDDISLLVIHNISLPPGKFGGPFITDLFLGKLDPSVDPYFEQIYQLEVSSHCLIRRTGEIIQYVSFYDRAWHAGKSTYEGRDRCNDFSIGIELEGTDIQPYTQQQYASLILATESIKQRFTGITNRRIPGHCNIAPDRKTDPGSSFDWNFYLKSLSNCVEQ